MHYICRNPGTDLKSRLRVSFCVHIFFTLPLPYEDLIGPMSRKNTIFSFYVIVSLLSLLRLFPTFLNIAPHNHWEMNTRNDYEFELYCKMLQCIQKLIYMHACN